MEGVFIKNYFSNIVNKFIGKTLKKKLGYDPGIVISDFELTTTQDNLVKVTLTAGMTKAMFEKLVEEAM